MVGREGAGAAAGGGDAVEAAEEKTEFDLFLADVPADKKIAILGFAFKSNTNDTRQSPSIQICKDLLLEGAEIAIYDPKVEEDKMENDLKSVSYEVEAKWKRNDSIEEATKDSDAIVVLTEWKEFYNINWDFIYTIMRKPSWVFDSRSIISQEEVIKANLNFWRIGDGTNI